MEQITVKVGQIWKDNDSRLMQRGATRTLEVRKIVDPNPGFSTRMYAECFCRESGKTVRINIKRFKPTTRGYVFIGESKP